MFFLRFITQWRFSYLDYLWLSAFLVLLMQHKFLLAFITLFVGALFSIYVEKKVNNMAEKLAEMEKQNKDAIWQAEADLGRKVNAIKKHRELFGSSLKEAHDVVKAYREELW